IEPIEPPAFLDMVTRLRTAHGLVLVPVDRGAIRALAGALGRGELVGLAVDRDVQGTGQSDRLFGRPARISHAAALLALRHRSPILPAWVRRLPGGRFHAWLGEPIWPSGEPAAMMARVLEPIEAAIREAPGQWVMFQRLFDGGHPPRA